MLPGGPRSPSASGDEAEQQRPADSGRAVLLGVRLHPVPDEFVP